MAIVPLAKKDIIAEIVHWFVFLTVSLTRVNTQIDCVHVMQVGWGTIAQKNVYSRFLGKIAIGVVVKIASIKHVIE